MFIWNKGTEYKTDSKILNALNENTTYFFVWSGI